MSIDSLIYVGLAFAFGGLLKGASGVGSPLVAIPLMVLLYDVQFAIAVFALPNLIPNLVQFFQYRRHVASVSLLCRFALAGGAGSLIGSFMLVTVSQNLLASAIVVGIVIFVIWRLARPQWRMSMPAGLKLSTPVGLAAGILQGASGISAPISITFLNLLKLERNTFIPTISCFFVAVGLVQVPLLIHLGVLTTERIWLSCFALIPLMAFMPVGAYLGKLMSAEQFNKLLLLLLSAIALRLAIDILF